MTKDTAKHECPYCGTTAGLRISQDGREYGQVVDLICADCFRGTDEGPCFDDLPVASHSIPIERLTIGSTITIIDPAWGRMAYLVENVEFDGYGYTVTYGDERSWSDTTYVDAGGSVDADGDLRADASIKFEEWEALNEVALARLDASLAAMPAIVVDPPVNLLDAVQAAGLRPTVSLDTVAALVCASLTTSYAQSIRESAGVPAEAAE